MQRRAGAALALLVVLLAADAAPGAGAGAPLPLVAGRCIRTGPIDTVEQLNRFVTTVRGDPGFAGGDVGASVRLTDDRELFVFGDTVRGADFDGQKLVHNSMVVFDTGCARVVIPPDRGAVIPDRPDGVGYWPMSVAKVARAGYDLVGVSAQRVRAIPGAGVFAFEVLGPAGALFRVPRGGSPVLLGERDFGPDRTDPSVPMWGAAIVEDRGWAYLYGTSRASGATSGGFSLRVARVRTDDLLDPRRRRYWDGERWGEAAGSAVALIPQSGGVSQTLSVFRRGNRWFAVSKRDDVLGQDLVIWTAPGPAGPFATSTVVARIPSDAATGLLRYMPLAHPDLLPEPDSVVVSYSQNYVDFDTVRDDPRKYRPRFLRVPLPAESEP